MQYKKLLIITLISAMLVVSMSAQAKGDVVMVLFGDSLIGSAGIEKQYTMRTRIEKKYQEQGINLEVINSGINGLDSAQGLTVVEDKVLAYKPDIVMISLGMNDFYKQIPPEQIRFNLESILWKIRTFDPNIKMILVGAIAYWNTPEEYSEPFEGLFPSLASKYQIPLYRSFTDQIANIPLYFQDDLIHPNGHGILEILPFITPYFDAYIREAAKKPRKLIPAPSQQE